MVYPIIGYGGGGGGVFQQLGGAGTAITPVDATAAFAMNMGTASNPECFAWAGDAQQPNDFAMGPGSIAAGDGYNGAASFSSANAEGGYAFAAGKGSRALADSAACFGGGQAHNTGDFVAGPGYANGDGTLGACSLVGVYGATAFGGGNAQGDGALSVGVGSTGSGFSFGGGTTGYSTAIACGPGSLADQVGASAFGGGQALDVGDFASGFGATADSGSVGGVGATAFGSSYATGVNGFAACGGQTVTDYSVAIGPCVAGAANSYAFGATGGPLVTLNDDGLGNIELDCAPGAAFVLGNIPTQTTVGASGGASLPPALPLGYLLVTIPGVGPVAIRYDNPS